MSNAKKTENLQSPLSVARGAGSAQEGVHHWLHERITAVASIPLMLWLVWSVMQMGVVDYTTFTTWLAQPVNAVLMILSIITIFYHAALGAQVIVEDYIHNECLKMMKLIGLKLFFLGAGIACVFSVLKIAFAG
ncbi:MAG: succinate dehydrogenase, hydrophobic membrane anchor protein [Micavibrio sp.]